MQNPIGNRYGPLWLARGLGLGVILTVVGMVTGDPGLTGCGALLWVFGYAYCAPWQARIIRLLHPDADHHMAAAIMGWGGAPWGLFIVYGDVLTGSAMIHPAVLAAMAPGGAAVIAMVDFRWQRRPSSLRSAVLVSGGLVYLGWIAAYLWLAAGVFRDVSTLGMAPSEALVAAIFMLPTPFIALWVAVRLLVAPLEAKS